MDKGLTRVASDEVVLNDQGKDAFIIYRNEAGELAVLLDQFRGGEWSSQYLPIATTDKLRKALNKAHKER